jgi:hypothetical protein
MCPVGPVWRGALQGKSKDHPFLHIVMLSSCTFISLCIVILGHVPMLSQGMLTYSLVLCLPLCVTNYPVSLN